MTNSISHRGPDDEGYFIAGPLGLGFRRLSIIDLAGGHQPMSDASESIWLVFNGEIYNFKELRAELKSHGHVFRTNSDTEVIIHGYKEWGTDVLGRLNGMFGLALWDVVKERLIVARDAMGIKLVYYRLDKGQLNFGSEMRAVLSANDESADIDPEALYYFLRFRYTPSPLTNLRGIRKLAPGTMLVAEKGECREERWYRFTPRPFAVAKKDSEAREELLQLYRAAVRRHMIADVPVGILLSGGLDSGLLLGLMNEAGGPWPAYTIGYGEAFEDDELKDAAETAALLGAKHIAVRINQSEFETALPRIVESLEEPVASSSIVPMYFVSERARQDVKVAIIGQGPDELFGGYKRHLGVRYGDLWRRLPSNVQSGIAHGVNKLFRNEMLKRGVHSLGEKDRLRRYQHVFSLSPAEMISGLFRDDVLPSRIREDEVLESWRQLEPQMAYTDELGGFQMLEIRSSLPDELLMFADKLSMAHGLEVRVPYLDRTIVEYVQRLKASSKIRRGTRKWLHRCVCQSYLPKRILRRKKRGFGVNVVDDWFHTSISEWLSDLLLDESSLMFQMLRPQRVTQLYNDHRAGRQDNHKLLFSLVMIEQWLRGVQSHAAYVRAGQFAVT